LTVVPEITPFA